MNTLTQDVETGALWKIREMYLSENPEDKDIAYKWLCQLIGESDAKVNLFILTFHQDYDSDRGVYIDADNYWDMKFKTYSIYFGKDYKYRVHMIAKFNGAEIMNEQTDYSRYRVGDGQPKYDMIVRLSEIFGKSGHKFYHRLFQQKP